MSLKLKNKTSYTTLVLAGTLAALAGLATTLAVGLAALAAHHLILAGSSHIVAAGVLAVLASVAILAVATSVGHFILIHSIFFTRVGKEQIPSRQSKGLNLLLDAEALQIH